MVVNYKGKNIQVVDSWFNVEEIDLLIKELAQKEKEYLIVDDKSTGLHDTIVYLIKQGYKLEDAIVIEDKNGWREKNKQKEVLLFKKTLQK